MPASGLTSWNGRSHDSKNALARALSGSPSAFAAAHTARQRGCRAMALQPALKTANAIAVSSSPQPGRSDQLAAFNGAADGFRGSAPQTGQGAHVGTVTDGVHDADPKGDSAGGVAHAASSKAAAIATEGKRRRADWRSMANLDRVPGSRHAGCPQVYRPKFTMWILLLEAGVALFLLLFIVWFTLPRKDRNGKE